MTSISVSSLSTLRQRRSEKWRTYPDDVLPLFVAEMDYDLAPPVTEALLEAVRLSDTGYPMPSAALGKAYAGFAGRRWGWEVDPSQVTALGDVSAGVTETLRLFARPGAPIVINPPVYPPFFDWVPEIGSHLLEVPLVSGRLDLDGLEAAFATHPAAYLLCNPHNPVGRVHTLDELTEVVRLARLYRVPVVSDEIHAPLVLPGATFTPMLSVPGAADVAISLVSGSKAFNLAGLKCAAVVTGSARMTEMVRRFPFEPNDRLGHFGVLATVAAFNDGDPWLDALLTTLDARRSQLADLLRSRLPQVSWVPPEATYLAWLDCSAYGTDEQPQQRFLAEAKVALVPGTNFGAVGAGFVRLNFATSPEILAEAINRMSQVRPGRN
jgi:cystathionine beta-lyase